MTRALFPLTLGLLIGCIQPRPDADTGDTSVPPDREGCPQGMLPARQPGLFINSFIVNGLGLSPFFDDALVEDAAGNERAAACITASGNAIDFIFLVADESYGRIAMSAPAADRTYDLNGNEALVSIHLFGAEGAPSFSNGEFTSGTWYVASVGAEFDADFNANGLTQTGGGAQMTIGFTLEAFR